MPNFLRSILRAPAGDGVESGGDAGADTSVDIYGADVDDAEDAPEQDAPEKPDKQDEPPVPAGANPAAPAATPAVASPAAPAAQPAASAAPSIDPKVIEDAIRKFVPQPATPAAPAVQKSINEKDWEELTDDEFNLRSKRVLVNPQMLYDIGIPDATPEQVDKFQGLIDGIASHAIELSVAEFQRAFKHAESRYEPMFSEYKKYQAVEAETKFYSEHKDLAELRKAIPKFDELVMVTAKSIQPKHPNGANKTYEDISAELAGSLRSIFKSIAPNGIQSSPATTPAPTAVTPVPVPASMPQPGRSSRAAQGNPAVAPGTDNGASIY